MTDIDAPTPEAQLHAARQGVLLLTSPIVDLEPLRIRGKDRVTWLNGMVTSDVAKLPVGSAQYSLHVGKTGKIVTELWILNIEDELLVGVPRGRAEELAAALDRYLIMEQCEIVAGQPDATFVLALGPLAARVVEHARALGLRAGSAKRAGLPCAVLCGEPALVAQLLADPLADADAPGAAVIATEEGWEPVRVELGIGKLGVDFDETAYPQEAALEVDAVSFSKGCYLGQEAVFMMQERGHPPRRMVQLEIAGGGLAIGKGAQVATADGAAVGSVTTAAIGDSVARVLATLKWKHAKGDTALSVDGRAARVTLLAAKAG